MLAFALAAVLPASAHAASSSVARIADFYVEARVAHVLVEERAKRVIDLKPFDTIGRDWADYQNAVVFLESRDILSPDLGRAAAALPAGPPADPWAAGLANRAEAELKHAAEDREAGLKNFAKSQGFGSPAAGQESAKKLGARVRALFGDNPYRAALKRAEAVASEPQADALEYTAPGYPVFLLAQARVMRRITEAFASDALSLAADGAGMSTSELKRILSWNPASFKEQIGKQILELGENLKGASSVSGDGLAYAAEARRELESAAKAAAAASTALERLRPRLLSMDRAAAKEDGPDALAPQARAWTSVLGTIEKRCRAYAAALPGKP